MNFDRFVQLGAVIIRNLPKMRRIFTVTMPERASLLGDDISVGNDFRGCSMNVLEYLALY